jgi:hypothetical protein
MAMHVPKFSLGIWIALALVVVDLGVLVLMPHTTAIDCTQMPGKTLLEAAIAGVSPNGTITCAAGEYEWSDSFNTAGKDGITLAGTKTTVDATPVPTPTTFRIASCAGGLAAGHVLSVRVPHPIPGGSYGVDRGLIESIDPETCDLVLATPLSGVPLTGEAGSVTGLTRIRYATATPGSSSVIFPNSGNMTLTGFAFQKVTPVSGAVVFSPLPEQTGHEVYENDFDNATEYAVDAMICNMSNTAGRCDVLVHHNTSVNAILMQVRSANSNHALTATLWGEESPWGKPDQAYVEDNTIYGPPQGYAGADCDYSGRQTLRFNRFIGAWSETHGTRGIPPGFGCRANDVHHNLFLKGTSTITSPFFIRGGGVFTWANSIDAAFQYDYEFNFDRNSQCGVPTGTPPIVPPYDENRGRPYPSDAALYGPGHGWHCLGQIGLGAIQGYDVTTDAWAAITSYTLEPANLALNRTCDNPPCLSSDTLSRDLLWNFQRGLAPCIEFQQEVPYAEFLASHGSCGSTSGTKAQLLAVNGGKVPVSAAYVYFYVTDEYEWNECRPGPDGQWYRGNAETPWAVINAPLAYPHSRATGRLCAGVTTPPPDPCACALRYSLGALGVVGLVIALGLYLTRRGLE